MRHNPVRPVAYKYSLKKYAPRNQIRSYNEPDVMISSNVNGQDRYNNQQIWCHFDLHKAVYGCSVLGRKRRATAA